MDELEDRMYFPKLNRKISLKKKKGRSLRDSNKRYVFTILVPEGNTKR